MHYAKLTLAGGLMVALYSPAMAQVNPNVDCTNPTAAMSAQCRTSPRDPTEGNRNTTTGGANTGAATGTGSTGTTGSPNTTGSTGATGGGAGGTGTIGSGSGTTGTGTGGPTGTTGGGNRQ